MSEYKHGLTESVQEMIILFIDDGWSPADIAVELDVTARQVNSYLQSLNHPEPILDPGIPTLTDEDVSEQARADAKYREGPPNPTDLTVLRNFLTDGMERWVLTDDDFPMFTSLIAHLDYFVQDAAARKAWGRGEDVVPNVCGCGAPATLSDRHGYPSCATCNDLLEQAEAKGNAPE